MTSRRTLPVAILAGGLATRLRPITETIPKGLVEVAGRPFLEHQLIRLRDQGIREVVLCVGYLGEAIRERFGNGNTLGIHIEYSFDGPTLLGTGGAIRKALPLLGDAFFILYGDSYLTVDFTAVENAFRESGKAGLMTVFLNQNLWDRSNIRFVDGKIETYDKTRCTPDMCYIDYGLSAFRREVFGGYAADGVLDLAEVMRTLVEREEMAGFEATQRFYEIGSPEGLRELDTLLRGGPAGPPVMSK